MTTDYARVEQVGQDLRFAWVDEAGRLRVRFHAGQTRAWRSEKRIIAVIAGTQSGKSVFGPFWLWREIREKGAGDYLAASPTYKMLNLKALPSFLWLFDEVLQLGAYNKTEHVFTVSPAGEIKLFGERQDVPTKVFFGYAEDPDSLESATAKAAWLDEAGQKKFKLGSWEAILRRLSIHQGRILITTTLYNLGWLVQKVWKPWQAGSETIDVVRFESIENPAFPRDEWERAKQDLPRWKFDLFYRGVPTRPAGVIYDNFSEDGHTRRRFRIPGDWPRYVGLDFGGVNTAALFYARRPGEPRLYLYREYKAGGRTASEHAAAILQGEPFPELVVGGSKSEEQWRDEFRAAGLWVEGPEITDVEVGIDRVYGFHARDEVIVFDDLAGYLDEKATYARELGDDGEPTEKIADKNSFHFMDAERYILGRLAPETEPVEDVVLDPDIYGEFVLT